MTTPAKTYIGDGVYVDICPQGIVLTTENGIRVTNEIVLEAGVYQDLLAWIGKQPTLGYFRNDHG